MKQEIRDMERTYDSCVADGKYIEKNEIDPDLIVSLKASAMKIYEKIKINPKNLKRDDIEWTRIFRDYYEILRQLIECHILFDKIEVENHICKNAYICIKHPELELEWEFLEILRLKRNSINYKGQLIEYEEWLMHKLKMDLIIVSLSSKIDEKLKYLVDESE